VLLSDPRLVMSL